MSPFARGPARAPEPFAASRTDAARWAELRAAGDRFAAFAAANRDAGERFGRLFRMLGARP